MYWVEVRFVGNGKVSCTDGKDRWEGLTEDQARSVYNHWTSWGKRSKFRNAWYVRMGEMS